MGEAVEMLREGILTSREQLAELVKSRDEVSARMQAMVRDMNVQIKRKEEEIADLEQALKTLERLQNANAVAVQ